MTGWSVHHLVMSLLFCVLCTAFALLQRRQLHRSLHSSTWLTSRMRRHTSERHINDWAKLAADIAQAKEKEEEFAHNRRGRVAVGTERYEDAFHSSDETVEEVKPTTKKRRKKVYEILRRDSSGIPIEAMKAGVNVKPVRRDKAMSRTVSGGSGGKQIRPQGKQRKPEITNPNRLRIIGGSARGKKIESPDVYLRPMMGKVREALYSTLTFLGLFESNTTSVLDIFSGSGSVGLEALSRGAARVTFVDMAQDCCDTAIRNADSCGFSGQANAVQGRAEDVLKDPLKYGLNRPFQLVTLTPPYEEVVYKELIDVICDSPLVEENTIVVIEYPVELGTLPHILGDDKLFGIRNRKYGRTVLGIYVYRPTKQYDMKVNEFVGGS